MTGTSISGGGSDREECAAAYTYSVTRDGHWPFAWAFRIYRDGEFVYGEEHIESKRAATKDAEDLIGRTLDGRPTTVQI